MPDMPDLPDLPKPPSAQKVVRRVFKRRPQTSLVPYQYPAPGTTTAIRRTPPPYVSPIGEFRRWGTPTIPRPVPTQYSPLSDFKRWGPSTKINLPPFVQPPRPARSLPEVSVIYEPENIFEFLGEEDIPSTVTIEEVDDDEGYLNIQPRKTESKSLRKAESKSPRKKMRVIKL
jgi:hypothetical protein